MYLYVDDLLISVQSLEAVQKIEAVLSSYFEMVHCEEGRILFGLETGRDWAMREFELSKNSYLFKVLERFSVINAKPIETPMEENNSKCQSQFHENL